MTLLLWKVSLFIVLWALQRHTECLAIAQDPSTPKPTSPHPHMVNRRSIVAPHYVGFIAVQSPRGDLWRKKTVWSKQQQGSAGTSETGKVHFK